MKYLKHRAYSDVDLVPSAVAGVYVSVGLHVCPLVYCCVLVELCPIHTCLLS